MPDVKPPADVQSPEAKDTPETKKAKSGPLLGLDKVTYIAGKTVKDGLIATAIIFAATFAFLQFAPKVKVLKPIADPVKDWIDKVHRSKYGVRPLYELITHRKMKDGPSNVGTIATLSFAFATLLSHFFQVKGAKEGAGEFNQATVAHNKELAEIAAKDAQIQEKDKIIAELKAGMLQSEPSAPAGGQRASFADGVKPAAITDRKAMTPMEQATREPVPAGASPDY